MIEELHIRNFALIDETTVQFQKGLNILTGETGAGKSVLIGALGLVLGSKADNSAVRTGCDEAEVTAVFTVESPDVKEWLKDHDLDASEDSLILRRKIRTSGRGGVYIQSRPFTLAELSELGKLLVDIHGQHDHQSLFYIDQHRRFLDKSGKLEDDNRAVQALFNSLKDKTEEIGALKEALNDIEKETELLNHSIEEIEDAALKDGEEDEIRNSLSRMEQSEQLYGTVDSLLSLLPENRGGSLASLRRGLDLLEKLSDMDPGSRELKDRFSNAFYELEDITDSIASLNDELSFSPGEKETLEDRLAIIKKICRKYGPGVTEVQSHLEECRVKLDQLDNSTDRLGELNKERDALEEELIGKARTLSEERKRAGSVLEKSVELVIKSLGMPSSVFSVGITQKTGEQGQALCGLNGLDRVEFLFTANKGEPLKPLKDVASGGELSRVMLGIKSALAGTDQIPILVFDEIDAGIGGEVGSSIGRHMKKLAGFHQILCITHLASIAVYADNHIKVQKTERENRTLTDLFALENGQKVSEIARMLSGDSEGNASISHAEELLRSASV
ncbi:MULTISPECIES: DNA repair protein RecN [unclassified Oceanispirochaeta]|uniref:DNA repair protein RecN n=1 Tax=unclassified Oceanispirochaeta TaxID=2635722 RepID=UPI000E091016|nr:DNA repair protein RecN [Oceanispirochaeta sp. M1]MBF9016123.1 DNA repair protein RecN [Oceanispirochaeta sp. M2]NPD72585.1 DNA repair protein RecN [Oceanispirochaeta sp. M1]RDG31737.1 DNA repair protein RecN [Oceanispirochaeta sp. M1]